MDRMVVNVANSIIASGSTALEVLEKAPGVTVDRQNGMLQLRGKDGVIVQLDGKQTYMSMPDLITLLRTMPSDNIDQIELITNPSAKYDAAGNSGIINIRLKKNNNEGTNGSLSLGIGSGRYARSRGSVQLNHRTKNLNFFGNYSANRGGNYFDLKSKQTIDNGEEHNLANQETYIRFLRPRSKCKGRIRLFLKQAHNPRICLDRLLEQLWRRGNSRKRVPEGGRRDGLFASIDIQNDIKYFFKSDWQF